MISKSTYLRQITGIFLFLVLTAFAGERRVVPEVSLYAPSLVLSGSVFQIAASVTYPYEPGFIYDFRLSSSAQLRIKKGVLKSRDASFSFEITTTFSSETGSFISKGVIPFDMLKPLKDETYIIVFEANAPAEGTVSLSCAIDVRKGQKIFHTVPEKDKPAIFSECVVYRRQRIAGSAALFSEHSFLSFSLDSPEYQSLACDFWISFTGGGIRFLEFRTKGALQPDFSLSLNESQILAFSGKLEKMSFYSRKFLSLNAWYHIILTFSASENAIRFYLNAQLIGEVSMEGIADVNSCSVSLRNDEDKKTFSVDALRWRSAIASAENVFHTAHTIAASNDSSRILQQLLFDTKSDLKFTGSLGVTSSGLNYEKSDAPLFATAPDLRVEPHGTGFQLEWEGNEFLEVNGYDIERSLDGKKFIQITSMPPFAGNENKFEFFDEGSQTVLVLYYRIKQAASDGSVAYSSVVKVSNAKTEPFAIKNNYPNPFNPTTLITIDVNEDTEAIISVHSMEGKEIAVLHQGKLSKGTHRFTFDGTGLPSGIYFYSVAAPTFTQTRKMILAK